MLSVPGICAGRTDDDAALRVYKGASSGTTIFGSAGPESADFVRDGVLWRRHIES